MLMLSRWEMRRDRLAAFLFVASFLVIAGTAVPADAHGLDLVVAVDGHEVVVEAHYVGGKSLENGTVSVLASDGRLLLSGTTGPDGRCSFAVDEIPDGTTLTVADAAGHRAEVRLTRDLLLARPGSADPRQDSKSFAFPFKRAFAGVGIICGLTVLAAYVRSRRTGKPGTPRI
jgi:hypothetical protein